MTRLTCLTLVVVLASHGPVQAQRKEAPQYHTNSLGMKFVWIRPGSFSMGSPKTEKGRSDVEVQHEVKLSKGFWMGVYPVTQEQWLDVIADPEYRRPAEGFDISNPSRFRGDKNLPVDSVSWNDCQVFLTALRAKDKQRYRLPTEAEWEYACRADTTTPYCFGDTITSAQANFAGGVAVQANGKKAVNRRRTTPVGTFPANAWGLYDMHGNVAQWCQDRFGRYALNDTFDPQGPDKGGTHLLRGGSWDDGPSRCRSACRAWDSADKRGTGTFGLRLCFSRE